MTRRVALCADDFGASAGVCEGIVELVDAGRLAAVSCLTGAAQWPLAAAALRRVAGAVDVGLHFNLSEGQAMSPALGGVWPRLPTLPRLIAMAHVGRLPRAALQAELDAQLAAFTTAFGRMPRFIDGHQHVHDLPEVREIVLDTVERLQPMPALRNTGRILGPGYGVKRALIEATGGRALRRELERRRIPHNRALSGVYDFAEPQYRTLMQRWLAEITSDGALLFCHPGKRADGTGADPIAAARGREFAYLRSAAFAEDLIAADVELGPVWTAASP